MTTGFAPLVSVIVPAFNAARTIESTIESALLQSHSHLEIIVCDDCSTDKTADVVRGISDPRIRLVSHDRNLGPGAARDSAMAQARGEWLALLDADDQWHSSRIAELLKVAQPGEIVFDDVMLCHDGTTLRHIRPVHGKKAFGTTGSGERPVELADYIRGERLLIQPLIHAPALQETGIRHSNRKFAEDAEFIISLGLAGMRLRYLPEALYYYRLTPGSLTTDRDSRGEMRAVMQLMLRKEGISEEVASALTEKVACLTWDEYAYEAVSCLANGQLSTFLRIVLWHPVVLPRILRRLPKRLHYEVDRILARVPAR